MITVLTLPGVIGTAGKRIIHDVRRKLLQAIKRRGHTPIAVTVYERRRGAPNIHGHILVHVPHSCVNLINRRHDPPMAHVRRADEHAIQYLAKQRRWDGPEIEAARPVSRQFELGDHIPGPRISLSKAAKALLQGAALEANASRAPQVASKRAA